MSNPVIELDPGTSYRDVAREFDAPVEAVFRPHPDPDVFSPRVGPRDLDTAITHRDFHRERGIRDGYEKLDALLRER